MRHSLLLTFAFLTLSGCDRAGTSPGGGDGDIAMTRDAKIGASYGSAGPRSCSPKNLPKDGPPSPAQAAAYVICDAEKESGGMLYLADKVVVTDIAKGRTYERNEGARYNIDTDQPVYAIRGSVEGYQCRPTYGEPRTNNCAITHGRNAEGDCYKTTFGDWRCFMVDRNAPPNEETDQPPPA